MNHKSAYASGNVLLCPADMQAAVSEGLITPQQAQRLWAYWIEQTRSQETRPAPLECFSTSRLDQAGG